MTKYYCQNCNRITLETKDLAVAQSRKCKICAGILSLVKSKISRGPEKLNMLSV